MSMAQQMRSRQSVRPAGSLKSVSHRRTASGKENSCMAQDDDACTLQANLQLAGACWWEKASAFACSFLNSFNVKDHDADRNCVDAVKAYTSYLSQQEGYPPERIELWVHLQQQSRT